MNKPVGGMDKLVFVRAPNEGSGKDSPKIRCENVKLFWFFREKVVSDLKVNKKSKIQIKFRENFS